MGSSGINARNTPYQPQATHHGQQRHTYIHTPITHHPHLTLPHHPLIPFSLPHHHPHKIIHSFLHSSHLITKTRFFSNTPNSPQSSCCSLHLLLLLLSLHSTPSLHPSIHLSISLSPSPPSLSCLVCLSGWMGMCVCVSVCLCVCVSVCLCV